jgi:hypothetical protein
MVVPVAIFAVLAYQYFFGVWSSGKNKKQEQSGRKKPSQADIGRKLDEINGTARGRGNEAEYGMEDMD